MIDPALGGRIVFTPSGNFLANCYEHAQGEPGGGSRGGSAILVDCSEALGVPGAKGIQVTTPSGGVYTNCKVHMT